MSASLKTVDHNGVQTPVMRRGKSGPVVEALALERRELCKIAFTTRRIQANAMHTIVSGPIRPRTGDLVLARVDKLGYQTRLELPSGRKAGLNVGDEIIVAYGDRYATDQFEAEVPDNLGPTNLVATGGVASQMISRSRGIRPATQITPIGLVGDADGSPLNLSQFAIEAKTPPLERPRVIAVLGTSMNSGKTTTNRYLVQGLNKAGYKPGVAKITGTGSGGDYWSMIDANAYCVVDFTDVGYASTYKVPTDLLERAGMDLITHLAEQNCGIILIEIADGLLHQQNIELLQSEFFRTYVDGVMFAAGDSMGAVMGATQLESLGFNVLGLSGAFTASELLIKETQRASSVPVYTKEELSDPQMATRIVGAEQSVVVRMTPREIARNTVESIKQTSPDRMPGQWRRKSDRVLLKLIQNDPETMADLLPVQADPSRENTMGEGV